MKKRMEKRCKRLILLVMLVTACFMIPANDAWEVRAAAAAPSKVSGTLLSKMTVKGDGLAISWSKVKGAAGYDIFFARCNHSGKRISCGKIRTIKGNKTFKWTKSKLRPGAAYKGYVKAYVMNGGKKKYVRTSPMIHAYAGNGTRNHTNAKSVKVNKTQVTLKNGKTFQIKAGVTKVKKGKQLMPKSHAPKVRYMSSNKRVATVSTGGKVTARGKGTCVIYVYAHNGVSKQVKIVVAEEKKQTKPAKPGTVRIDVTKAWSDAALMDKNGKPLGGYARPASVTVELLDPSGKKAASATLTEKSGWSGSFTDLPEKNKSGSVIDYAAYTVVEKAVPAGFTCKAGRIGKKKDGNYAVTVRNNVNSYEKYTSVPFALYAVNKNTVDGNNISQAVNLGGAEFTLTNESSPASIRSLVTDANGKAVHRFSTPGAYILAERSVPSPYAKDDGTLKIVVKKGGLTGVVFDAGKGKWALTYGLTYSFQKPGTGAELAHLFPEDVPGAELGHSLAVLDDIQQEYLTLTVNKVWEDNSDFYQVRPGTFTLVVRKELNSGVHQHIGTVSVESSSESAQICSFDQAQDNSGRTARFERYKPDGSEWVYNIYESIADYSKPYVFTYEKSDGSSYWMGTDSGGTITGWLADNQTFAKAWNDRKYFTGEAAALGDANEYRRPIGIEYDLVGMADGKEVWKEEGLFIDSESSYGTYTWMKSTLAPKFSGSSLIEYRVVENVPAGYVVTDAYSTIVTNTPVEEDKVEPLVLTIKKVDEPTGAPLAGAVFTAKPSDPDHPEEVIVTAPTDANGETTLTFDTAAFVRSDWEIVEQLAPEGYVPGKTAYKVVLDKTLTSIKPVEIESQGETQTVWQWGYSSAFGQGTHDDIKDNAQGGYTLTVKNAPTPKFTFAVRKKWVGEPMADATVQVKNGNTVEDSHTFEASAFVGSSYILWQIPESEALPAYDRSGKLIEYTVHEVVPDNAEFVAMGNDQKVAYSEGGPLVTVTIANTPATEVQVKTVWNDDAFFDASGKPLGDYARPDSVTIVLTDKDPDAPGDAGSEVGRVVLTAENADDDGNWVGTIKAPKYDASEDEIDYAGYYLVESPVSDGFESTPGRPTKGSDGGWAGEVKNSPRVREEFFSNYTVFAVDMATVPFGGIGGLIANSTMLEGAELTLTAEGASTGDPIVFVTGADGKATDKLNAPGTYILAQTKEPTGYVKSVGSLKVIASKGDLDSLTFDNQKNEWVRTYKLTFRIDRPDEGMTLDITSPTDVPEAGASIAVLNASVTTSKTVTKTWVDGSNASETRPGEITLVVKDGEAFEKSVTFGGSGDTWSETVAGLPQYRGKSEIAYTVDEPEVPLAPAPDWTEGDRSLWEDLYRYDSQVDGFSVTNTLMMAANGQVTWEVPSNAASGESDERIPAQVDIVLQRLNGDDPDDEAAWTDVDSVTVQTGRQTQVDSSNGYNLYSFGYIPVYDASGNQITYRVVAPDCPMGWECVGSIDNLVFRPATVTLTLEKIWDDNGNAAGKRPELYGDLLDAVGLYVGGEPIENTPYKDSCYRWMDGDKSQGDTWVANFSVPKYANDLKTELEWDIREVGTFKGYTNGQVVKGDDGVFRATNTYTE